MLVLLPVGARGTARGRNPERGRRLWLRRATGHLAHAYVAIEGGTRLSHVMTALSALGDAGATDIELGPASTVGDVLRVAMGRDELAWELFLAVEQVALDGSDPAVHAARPQVGSAHAFMAVGQDDELVTRAAGQALARALGLPQVEPVVEVVATLSPATPPLVGNAGGLTRGFFQHDVVTRGGQVVASTHNATLNSPEVATQLRAWWSAWVAGTPQIVAP